MRKINNIFKIFFSDNNEKPKITTIPKFKNRNYDYQSIAADKPLNWLFDHLVEFKKEVNQVKRKAKTYLIPFDENNLTHNEFIKLAQKVYEYEFLIKEAKIHGIEWDYLAEYNPVYLRQEIDNAVLQASHELIEKRFAVNI